MHDKVSKALRLGFGFLLLLLLGGGLSWFGVGFCLFVFWVFFLMPGKITSYLFLTLFLKNILLPENSQHQETS